LRIGLSTAKGLSFALDKPVVSIATFEGIAVTGCRKHPELSTVYVVMDAKRDEWYVGGYHVEGGNAVPAESVRVKMLSEALAGVVSGSLVLTDNVDAVRQVLSSEAIVDDALQYCRGDVVASLGYQKAQRGEYADVAALEPMYLKDFIVRTAVSVS
jgi:tRNA threonylcarbamoyladenosine biosynthesis protein TsaB